MQAIISEDEQNHIYSCLLAGGKEFEKVKKSLAKLNREDKKVDDEIELNAKLRREFNPRAEEEARERERAKRDPAQMDIADVAGSSGETGGATRTRLAIVGEDERQWTDLELRDGLMECDRMVLLSDIRGWTSSERDASARFIGMCLARQGEDSEPDEPEHLGLFALTEERVDFLNRAGPWRCVGNPDDADDAETTKIVRDDEITGEVYAEFTDGVEAEVKCARLNREFIKNDGMDDALAGRWFGAGPWSAVGEGEKWYVVLEVDGVKEQATSEEDAHMTAARYNRSVAGREDDGSWREPPLKLTEEQVQEVRAAAGAE